MWMLSVIKGESLMEHEWPAFETGSPSGAHFYVEHRGACRVVAVESRSLKLGAVGLNGLVRENM